MGKGVQNLDAVAHKLEPALTRVSNYRLEVAREKKRKIEEMVEKRKTKAMATKRRKDRGGINLSSEEEGNCENDNGDDTDPDQVDDKYPLQNWLSARWDSVQVLKQRFRSSS